MTGTDGATEGDPHPASTYLTLESGGNAVTIDLSLGNIAALRLAGIAPLHRAPWVGEPAIEADAAIAPVERRLSGDFFCMPFGGNDLTPGPVHGFAANSPWRVIGQEASSARLALEAPVFGARLEREVTIAPDAPLLYQRHRITGGQGEVTFAHHPMVSFAGQARFFCSPKRRVITAQTPLEPGRNRLVPTAGDTLSGLPATDGGQVDLARLPIGTAHEDFVTLIEEEGRSLGWSAVMRDHEDDIIFVLKNALIMPLTMLWHSNGGRDYSPWNGRHRNVLGIEDGRAAGEMGHAAALGPSIYSENGAVTTVTLGGTLDLPHVIGAVPRPAGWDEVRDITVRGDRLVIHGPGSQEIGMPFEAGFLGAI